METLFDAESMLSEPTRQDDHLDSVIADAMNRLSVQDREKVIHEVHGVSDGIKETPGFVAEKLEELQQELARIKESGRLPTAAFELAESLSPPFVENRQFRMTFLRCDDFNARLAAERFVKHFDFKFWLFGGEKLCKHITYDDLDKDDIDAVERGFLQWLPERDRAGRPIGIFFPSEQKYNAGCDIARVFGRLLFFHHSMLRDDEVSAQKGFVVIFYNMGPVKIQNLHAQVPPTFSKAMNSFPTKTVSLHVCFSNFLFRIVVQNLFSLFRHQIRAAGKVHQGSQQEVIYSLMTYGIPTDLLPVHSSDDTIKKNNWLELVNASRKRDEYSKKNTDTGCCIIPFINDVLFGKGASLQERPGNVRLKVQVDELLPLYNTLDKSGKIDLGIQVVETVKETGGRFLSRDTGVFMVVPDEMARAKVANLFRNRRKASLKAAKKGAATQPPQFSSGVSEMMKRTSLDGFVAEETVSGDGNKRPRL